MEDGPQYKHFVFRFGNDLQISDKLFVMDAGASNSKEMKLLRSHLQELRTNIISVSLANIKHTLISVYFKPPTFTSSKSTVVELKGQ